MKSTGIIRRVDDLGRVVIPKEIRRSLSINEGEALEIYTDKNTVIFKKYVMDSDRLKEECAKIVKNYRSSIETVSFINGVTTVVLTTGKVGKVKFNPADEFDFNVGIVYAMKNAGIEFDVDGL